MAGHLVETATTPGEPPRRVRKGLTTESTHVKFCSNYALCPDPPLKEIKVPHTGQACEQSGIYGGDDAHREEIALSKNETFPPCGDCNRAVNWTLIRATEN